MGTIEKRIGLSLGADLCWPACYEAIMKQLDLKLRVAGDEVTFAVDRVFIEPFDLREPCTYDVVIDRLTHWYRHSREWIKKGVIMDGLYVLNNPWSLQSMEKHTTFCAMMQLGMPIPNTWMVPPKAYEPTPDLQPTLERYAKLFDVSRVGERLQFPVYVKPYDGGGWRSVKRCVDAEALREAYETSGTEIMHVQAGVAPSDGFVRVIGMGPLTRAVSYDADAPQHDRYTRSQDFASAAELEQLRKVTLTINSFFGWEFNSCESMRKNGVWHPIDFANPCPDSQVTSLHYHFPWLVTAFIKWSVFAAASGRKMRQNLDWEPYFEVAASERSFAEKLDAYAAIADERLESDRFFAFCDEHLGHVDEVVWNFFASEEAKGYIRAKVEVIYPAHEVEQFTELFWGRIQQWRNDNNPGENA